MLDVASLTGIQSDTANLWIAVWVIGLVGSVYAIWGGLRTVAVSDTLNGFGLLLGGILITIFGLNAVSDGGGLLEGLVDYAHRASGDVQVAWYKRTVGALAHVVQRCSDSQSVLLDDQPADHTAGLWGKESRRRTKGCAHRRHLQDSRAGDSCHPRDHCLSPFCVAGYRSRRCLRAARADCFAGTLDRFLRSGDGRRDSFVVQFCAELDGHALQPWHLQGTP